MRTDPLGSPSAGLTATPARTRRGLRRVLAAVTVGCLAAAAVVVAVGWRWTPPPRVELIPAAAPPPRQQQAFDLVTKWTDAENRSDAALLRELSCATPSENVQRLISTVEHVGTLDFETYPEGVVQFRDESSRIWLRTASRLRPLSEEWRQRIQSDEGRFGLWANEFTLVDEGGRLTVCDFSNGSP